jgi:SPP1 gp7 family putative phage head morphogenesis protein
VSISDETLRLTERLRRDLNRLTDAQARDLVAGWARAWDEVAGDLDDALQALALQAGDGALTRTMLRRSARLASALQVIGGQLRTLADDAGVRIVGDLDEIVELAGTSQDRIVRSQLPKSAADLVVTWDRVDEHVIEAIVMRSTQQIQALTRPLSAEAERAMKRELLRGLSVGANPRETARRMVRRVEGRFNGGLTRALTISRTESLDALRAGARASHQANAAVLQGWIWTAQLEARTCPACWAMHGSVHQLSEAGPLGHQNCRCARTPKTLSWRDLGIDLDEPADVLPDAGRAFRALPKADQVAVLGPGRYDAWARGDLPMDDWAVKRSTSGWRDSFVPVKVPA